MDWVIVGVDDEFSIRSGSSCQAGDGDDGERDCDGDDSRRGSVEGAILHRSV